jgi:hypothetical protein
MFSIVVELCKLSLALQSWFSCGFDTLFSCC